MFRKMLFAAAVVSALLSADWAQAQNMPIFSGFHRPMTGCGCDTGCAAPSCTAPSCTAPSCTAPACGCEPASCGCEAPACGCEPACCSTQCFDNRMIGAGLLDRIDGAVCGTFDRLRCMCKSVRINQGSCYTGPSCCGAPAACGCDAAPSCCAPSCAAPACSAPACSAPSCAAPSCCAPTCGSEPACGSEPGCGCGGPSRPIMSRMGMLRDMLFRGDGCCAPSCAAPGCCDSCSAPSCCGACSMQPSTSSMYAPPAVKVTDPMAPTKEVSPMGPPAPPADTKPTPADPLKGAEPAAPQARRPVALPPVQVPDGASASPRLIRPSSLQQVEPTPLRVQTARPASEWKARTR